MTTKILGSQIEPFTIETTQLSNTAVSAFAQSLAPKVLYANVANSAFTVLDDTAVNIGGGYIVVTGSDFQSGATVLIDTTPASAVTFVNSTTLRVQVPTKAAASYNLYVVNPDGGVGVKVSGITYSSDPTWVTSSPLSNQIANTAFNVTLSATGATSYSLAAGSTLPPGTSLLANGYFSGTVSIGSQTTYSFVIRATDAELQDADKTFGVTVTISMAPGLYFIGNNSYRGVAGLNDMVDRSSPVQVGTNTNWNSISRNTNNAVATKTDGTLWLWGDNNYGQLGLNDRVYRSSPTQVGSNTTWAQGADKISTGAFNNGAIKTDGTLWLWGRAHYGVNGQNQDAVPGAARSSPTQVGGGTDWNKLFLAGGNNGHAFAIKTNGTLWAWGQGNSGTLGLNENTSKSSPVQVGASTNWSLVSACAYVAAIKTDGTLWTWGGNGYGVLGRNNPGSVYTSSPTQVGVATNWSKVDVGNFSMGAIKTDGTLWTWGRNQNGQLGRDDVVDRSSPVQVGVATNWSQLTMATSSPGFFATKTDGTLWAWGSNFNGALGQNDRVYRSSPVQIGTGTSWSQIAAGARSLHAIVT